MLLIMVIMAAAPDVAAAKLLTVPRGATWPGYTNRTDELLMSDFPLVRAAVKRQVVKRDLMYGYQANMFDGGFGEVNQALLYAREALCRPVDPGIPIRRGVEP